MKEKVIALGLSIILLASICIPAFATSTSELKDQKQEIENKIKEMQGEKTGVKQEINTQMSEISNLDASISDLDSQISKLNSEISSLETSIKETEKRLQQKQKEHEENQELMEERLVVMYETGGATFLDMLFNSKSIVEFISNYYMLSQITQCDKELLETIEQEQKEIEEAKTKLEQQKEQVSANKKEKEAKNNLLKTQKAQREEKLNSLSAEEKSLQNQIDSYNKKVDQIEAQIQEAIRKAEEDARRRANQSGGSGSSSSGIAGLKFDGSFIWPCNNKIVTSTVKRRWGRMHKGIDIGASYENVYASASGYAYNLENPSGYGHYIMIIHGDGYITLYGHLNAYKISYGQYVTQGQIIAQSGSTGSSTAPHLHFEIRRASSMSSYFSASPLNPLDYLPGGYSFAAGAQTPS